MSEHQIIELTTDIVVAYASYNKAILAEVPKLAASVFTVAGAVEPVVRQAPAQQTAVSIRTSIKPALLICRENGAKLRILKRYLNGCFQLSPEEYRAKWVFPRGCPMVAPHYAETRRLVAQSNGLGRKGVSSGAAAPSIKLKAPTKAISSAGDEISRLCAS